MEHKLRKILLLIGLALLIVLIPQKAFAAKEDGNVGFTVTPVIPSTQLDVSRSFFYVKTEPGVKQELEAKLVSTSKEKIKVEVLIENGTSTESGKIGYGKPLVEEKSLKDPISKLVKSDVKEVELEPFETKTVKLTLTPPKEHYEGVKFGAVQFRTKEGKQDDILDVYNAYQVGIVTSESGDSYHDGETLNLIEAKATLSNGRKVVQANLQNPEPKIVDKLLIKAELIDTKSKETIKKSEMEDFALAPNSILPFTFDWGVSNLKPGDYEVKMKISNNDHNWDLSKRFKISSKEAQSINEKSPYRIKTPKWMKITAIVMEIVVVADGVYLINRNTKWRKEEKALSRKSKKRNRKKKKEGRK